MKKPRSYDVVDDLVPDPLVLLEFDISPMTLWRWDRDPALGFPPPIRIRQRKYRSRAALDEFKKRLMRDAIARRHPTGGEAA